MSVFDFYYFIYWMKLILILLKIMTKGDPPGQYAQQKSKNSPAI